MPSCLWEGRFIAFGYTNFLPATHCLPSICHSDVNFDIRSQAAHRLWSALEQRPLGSPPLPLPFQRRRRLALAVRALDARMDGSTYREIAEVLFGPSAFPNAIGERTICATGPFAWFKVASR